MPDPADAVPDAVVFTAGASALDEASIKRLKDEFGLDLRVRSSSTVIGDALRNLGDAGVVFFDKTSPGYDKVFDKTSPGASEIIDVINPVEIVARVQDIERRLGRPEQ